MLRSFDHSIGDIAITGGRSKLTGNLSWFVRARSHTDTKIRFRLSTSDHCCDKLDIGRNNNVPPIFIARYDIPRIRPKIRTLNRRSNRNVEAKTEATRPVCLSFFSYTINQVSQLINYRRYGITVHLLSLGTVQFST